MEPQQEQKNCASGFNYCFWAKLLVGLPTLFIIVIAVGGAFTHPLLQMLGGALAGIATVYLAMRIERIPALQKKITLRKPD